MSFLNEVIFQHTLWVCRVHAHVIIWYRCLLSSTGTHIPDEYHLYCLVISICLLIVNTDWFLMSWVRCWRSFQKLTMQQHAQSNASSQQHCQKAKMAETKYVQRNVYKDMELCIACMGDAQDITPRPGHLKMLYFIKSFISRKHRPLPLPELCSRSKLFCPFKLKGISHMDTWAIVV